MFYPILLSMMAAAAAGVPANGPEPTIRVTLNNESQYLPGDRAKVQVITRDDGYLLVFHVNPDGRLRVLFPLDPTDDSFVKGGKRYLLLGRGGREGFTVDVAGTGVVFAAVSVAPWSYNGYVQSDHWDLAALNTITYDDTESQLVILAQGMAGSRFDYDIVGYTVASQVAATEEPAYVSGSVGVVDGCFNCVAPVGVVYGTGYYNTWGLYDPWYYSPYYNYGPYYPAWGYGPSWGWYGGYYGGYGGYWNGGYWNSGYWGNYYPPYPTAVPYAPYSPYQKKQWDRTWNGSPVPYRPRGADGYTATNTVSGQLPGIGVQQHATFRDRTWSSGGAIAGGSAVTPGAVPVSKGSSAAAGGGRRRDAAPAPSASRPPSGTKPSASSSNPAGTGAPMAVPSRPRSQSSATRPATDGKSLDRPEARLGGPSSERPTAVAAPRPSVSTLPSERRMSTPSERPSRPEAVPVSRPAAEAPQASQAPTATKASGTGRSSEPVLRRREPDQPSAVAAPSARQGNGGQLDPSLGRSYGNPPPPSVSPPSQPSAGVSGGGYSGGGYSGGGGRATTPAPSAPPPSAPPPGAVSGSGRRH